MITGLGRPRPWLSRPRLFHLVLIALYLAVASVVIVELIAWISDRPADWGAALGPLVGGFVGVAIATPMRLRRVATPEMWAEYRQALRSGVLPSGAEKSDWPAMLADRQRELRQNARVQYVVGVLLGVGWLSLMIGHRMGWWGWLVGIGLAIFLALAHASSRWQGQRLGRLREQLDARR